MTLQAETAFFRRSVPITKARFPLQPQHSVCCPLNRTIIMKTVILAVLLFLAVVTIVLATTESGAPTESGKSLHGHETCLVVILQTLKW
jgi:hypothetical protein